VNAAQMYPWKRSLDQELKESGELVPKSQVLGLQKRVEELERVLGRKVLEVDLFKKSTSSRGSDYPRGQKMAGTERRLFGRVCVPDVQQASEVALLPPARRAGTGGRTQSALGLGYYGHPGLGWTEGTLGDHDRLCGPDGAGLAFCQADHRRRPSRDVAGGGVLTVRRGARPSAQGIKFLSDNGPEYTSHRFRPFVRAMELLPCHTPRRSPESNGLAEAFFGSVKRDYVYQACLETFETVERQIHGWIDHYNQQAPHSALGMQSPAAF